MQWERSCIACMMISMRETLLSALFAVAFLAACDDTPPPPPPPPGDGGADSGGMDAGPFDAGPPGDGAMPDAMEDLDARPFVDGGVPVCVVAPADRYKLSAGTMGGDRIVGFAAGGDSFGAAWHETRAGQTDIFARRITPGTGLGTEQRITNVLSRQRAPSLVAAGSRWIASWVDNEGSAGFDVRTQLLNADLSPSGSVHAITATDALGEDNPTLVNVATGPMLFWVEDDVTLSTRTARALSLNADGTARGTQQMASSADSRPGQLAAGELTDGPVLLWAEVNLLMQPLSAAGALRGAASTVSVESNVDGTVDAALGVSGGAVVFGVAVAGVRNEVRFRALSSAGTFVGDERSIVSPPVIARDPSITAFAGGYAISYRGDPADGMGPRIYLMLVDAIGNPLDSIEVASAAVGGGRTTIRATGTGQLGIAWADQQVAELAISVAIIRCGG